MAVGGILPFTQKSAKAWTPEALLQIPCGNDKTVMRYAQPRLCGKDRNGPGREKV